MPQLFPTFEPPSVAEDVQTNGPQYLDSLLFDFESGDFVLDGTGRLMIADGHTSWVQWCQKAVITERFAYLIYGTNFGSEIRRTVREHDRKAAESWIEREITEAITIDSRSEMVRDFKFSWSGDNLTVSFTAVPVIGPPEQMEVGIA